MNAFKALCQPGRVTIGTWIMSASHIVAEAVGHVGFDWAVVDMEHAPIDTMDVVHLLQALAGTKTVPVVRCRGTMRSSSSACSTPVRRRSSFPSSRTTPRRVAPSRRRATRPRAFAAWPR